LEPLFFGFVISIGSSQFKFHQKEFLMRRLFPKVGLVGFVVAAITISFCFTALAAEKKKFAFSKKREKTLSEVNLHDRTDTKYRITQFSYLDVITEHTDRDLVGAEETFYGQTDYRASMYKGDKWPTWGYLVTRSKDEDCFYAKIQGMVTVMETKGWQWETESEIKIEIFGGTGKYLGVKGSGICKAQTMSSGTITKCEGEWDF
jgi:hypothetical protein